MHSEESVQRAHLPYVMNASRPMYGLGVQWVLVPVPITRMTKEAVLGAHGKRRTQS